MFNGRYRIFYSDFNVKLQDIKEEVFYYFSDNQLMCFRKFPSIIKFTKAIEMRKNVEHCLSFRYWPGTSYLKVTAELKTKLLTRASSDELTLVSTNDSRRTGYWRRIEIPISKYYYEVDKLKFHIQMKNLEYSPAAIDDIEIWNTNCKGQNFHCTFDIGFCNWKALYFVRRAFHSKDFAISSGKYFIIANHNASLALPYFLLPSHHTFCIRFFYKISGRARLLVYPNFLNQKLKSTALFEVDSIRNTIQTDKWFRFERTVFLSIGDIRNKLQLVFKVIAEGKEASVSLDDVTFITNVCMNRKSPTVLPSFKPCKSDEFQCSEEWSRYNCIKSDYRCDGRFDCQNSRDEQNCPTTHAPRIGIFIGISLGLVLLVMLSVIILLLLIRRRKIRRSNETNIDHAIEPTHLDIHAKLPAYEDVVSQAPPPYSDVVQPPPYSEEVRETNV
ncbi:DgyrCDS11442 [Dimorphilus gyrociliatus]|uniref:DgyrCDS11442 n=1 Tax=Dimorphilus gyrociliatus TaxID=2664684 RepID=A0A7I8W3C7_9ANNE|nr:DgyrCDS11442 [Dimorphilus gyrociliatus]